MINDIKRVTTLQFIRAYHPDLYDELKSKVSGIVADEWIPSQSEADLYNSIIKKYCEEYGPELLKKLTL